MPHPEFGFGKTCSNYLLRKSSQARAMMIPLIKTAHPTECNEISQAEITSGLEILPTHSTNEAVPTYPNTITYAPNNYGHIAEVSVLSDKCMEMLSRHRNHFFPCEDAANNILILKSIVSILKSIVSIISCCRNLSMTL